MENADNNKSPGPTNPQPQSTPGNSFLQRPALEWSARLMLVLVLAILASNATSHLLTVWTHLLPLWWKTTIETTLDLVLFVPVLYFFAFRPLIRENTQRKLAEVELRESEEKYRRLFDSSKDAFMTLTPPDWRFTSGNPSTVAMFRARDEAEFTSKAPWKLSPERQPDGRLSAEKAKAMIEQALREGHHYFEWTHKRLDGEEFPATVLLTRLELKGRILLNASVRDITERKHDENRLRLFRALLDQSTDAIVVVNPATARIMDVNESACVNLGYTREELLALRGMDIGASISDFAAFERNTQQLKAAGALRFESEQRCKDGHTFPVEVSLRYISRPEGDYALAIARDITERKQAEQAQSEALARFAGFAEASQYGMGIADMDGHILFANATLGRLLGAKSAAECLGKHFPTACYPPLMADKLQAEVMPALLRDGHWHGELELLTVDGRRVPTDENIFVIRDKQGQPRYIADILTDITERQNLARLALRTQRLESLGNLASGIAHDLNNILAPILMSAQLLQMSKPEEEAENLLATIVGSAKRGANIVKQVLTFARGVEGERVPVQPKFLIKEMEKIVRETFPKNITFRSEAPKGLWSVTGDATQLHQVLMNLCVNARDAMPNGGTLILSAENVQVHKARSGLFANAKPGPHLLIRVSDTGEGIPPAIIERIFEPFFTTKELGKGTGLGLSTVLGIVRSHGGFVDVESEPGRGSTFKVYLPAQPAEETQHLRRAPAASPTGAGEWVLVVDDEANIRDMTRATLLKHGYEVLVAANGKEALDLLSARADQLKAVITDIVMPVMDGVALVRAMKQSYPHIPVIACSGWGQEGLQAQLKELGVKTFLEKPYEAEKVLAALHEHLTAAS